MLVFKFVVSIFLGYLIGAIPFGLIVAKLWRGVDVREYGSGKTGSTNVLRTVGVKAGLFTLAADLGKGALPAIVAWLLIHGHNVNTAHASQVTAALAAVVGHNWPIYVKFRGGRGLAPYIGGMAAMYWPVALGCGIVLGLGTAFLTRYMSLGSIVIILSFFAAMLSLAILDLQPTAYLAYTVAGGGLILFQHRDNIQRLRTGTERKIGKAAEKKEPLTGYEAKG